MPRHATLTYATQLQLCYSQIILCAIVRTSNLSERKTEAGSLVGKQKLTNQEARDRERKGRNRKQGEGALIASAGAYAYHCPWLSARDVAALASSAPLFAS